MNDVNEPRQDSSVATQRYWLERFRASHAKSALRAHDPSFGVVFQRGQGARLWDVDGHEWLDLTCGYSASNFGHAFQPLVDAATAQMSRLTHVTGEPHMGRIELAEVLLQRLGPEREPGKVVFNTSGGRAIESAWKAAHAFRPGELIVHQPGFHGRTIATASLSNTRRSPLSDSLSESVKTLELEEYPYCSRCPLSLQFPSCNCQCGDRLVTYLQRCHDRVSAVLVEPALGARGYVFPPPEYFQRLRRLTRELGVLLIADEIQSGLGRAGGWLLSRLQGWEADLVVVGKSLGGGIAPIAAVVGRASVLDAIAEGAESETFAASPLACGLALQVIELLADGQLFARGAAIGEALRGVVLRQINANALAETVGVEGQAASCVLEFSGEPKRAARMASHFALACRGQRLRVHLSGPLATRVVALPPLSMTDEELADAKRRLANALQSIQAKAT